MARYIISKSPVRSTRTQAIIGWQVRLSDGTSYFERVLRVPPGTRVNYGPTWVRR